MHGQKIIMYTNSYGTMTSTWYILRASRKQQEVSNHDIKGNFVKSMEIGHLIEGILCNGLASVVVVNMCSSCYAWVILSTKFQN